MKRTRGLLACGCVALLSCAAPIQEDRLLLLLDMLVAGTATEETRGLKKLFVTAATHNGDFDNDAGLTGGGAVNADGNGIQEADRLCANDANHPGSGDYKALLVDGTNRRACSSANCSGGGTEHIDWPLAANTDYLRADDSTLSLPTNDNGIFVFGTLANSTGAGTATYWTGLNSTGDWTTDTRTCTTWTDPTGGANQGERGLESATDATAFSGSAASPQCNQTYALLCVEQ